MEDENEDYSTTVGGKEKMINSLFAHSSFSLTVTMMMMMLNVVRYSLQITWKEKKDRMTKKSRNVGDFCHTNLFVIRTFFTSHVK